MNYREFKAKLGISSLAMSGGKDGKPPSVPESPPEQVGKGRGRKPKTRNGEGAADVEGPVKTE
jgi:hypothetical protein